MGRVRRSADLKDRLGKQGGIIEELKFELVRFTAGNRAAAVKGGSLMGFRNSSKAEYRLGSYFMVRPYLSYLDSKPCIFIAIRINQACL